MFSRGGLVARRRSVPRRPAALRGSAPTISDNLVTGPELASLMLQPVPTGRAVPDALAGLGYPANLGAGHHGPLRRGSLANALQEGVPVEGAGRFSPLRWGSSTWAEAVGLIWAKRDGRVSRGWSSSCSREGEDAVATAGASHWSAASCSVSRRRSRRRASSTALGRASTTRSLCKMRPIIEVLVDLGARTIVLDDHVAVCRMLCARGS